MEQDHEDYRKLMSAILRQAMDDYIKLQHPKCRQRKYEREAFWSARDLLWDDSCELSIADEEGKPIGLQALAMLASDRENVNLRKLRSYLISESIAYWNQKQVRTISIPQDVTIEGHIYSVHQADDSDLDFDNKIVYLDKLAANAEEQFMQLLLDLTCHHSEIKTSAKTRAELGTAIYRLLRINSCFTGDC